MEVIDQFAASVQLALQSPYCTTMAVASSQVACTVPVPSTTIEDPTPTWSTVMTLPLVHVGVLHGAGQVA
jgi:hypothetical protein